MDNKKESNSRVYYIGKDYKLYPVYVPARERESPTNHSTGQQTAPQRHVVTHQPTSHTLNHSADTPQRHIVGHLSSHTLSRSAKNSLDRTPIPRAHRRHDTSTGSGNSNQSTATFSGRYNLQELTVSNHVHGTGWHDMSHQSYDSGHHSLPYKNNSTGPHHVSQMDHRTGPHSLPHKHHAMRAHNFPQSSNGEGPYTLQHPSQKARLESSLHRMTPTHMNYSSPPQLKAHEFALNGRPAERDNYVQHPRMFQQPGVPPSSGRGHRQQRDSARRKPRANTVPHKVSELSPCGRALLVCLCLAVAALICVIPVLVLIDTVISPTDDSHSNSTIALETT